MWAGPEIMSFLGGRGYLDTEPLSFYQMGRVVGTAVVAAVICISILIPTELQPFSKTNVQLNKWVYFCDM